MLAILLFFKLRLFIEYTFSHNEQNTFHALVSINMHEIKYCQQLEPLR